MLNKISTSAISTLFFVLVILSDFHYKLLSFGYLNSPRFTLIIKLTIGIFYGVKILMNISRKILFLILALVICSCVSVLFLETDVYLLGQYYFGLIICIYFFSSKEQFLSGHLLKVIEIIVILNFIMIVLGYFLDINIFRTYKPARFGYNGFLKSTSVASYFYIFSILLFMFRKEKSRFNNFLLFISMLSSLFIGSKTLYVFVPLSVIVVFLRYAFRNNKKYNLVTIYLTIFSVIFLLGVLFSKPLLALNKTLSQILDRGGIITAFFSYRDVLFMNALDNIKKTYNFLNYMFGGVYKIEKLTEMALVDLFLTFGVLGSIIYIIIMISIFPRVVDFNLKIMLILVAILIFLRGNFLYFPSDIFISIVIFAFIIKHTQYDNHTL